LKLKSFNWKAERFLYASTRDFLNANSVMSGKEKDEILNILVCSKNNRGIMALLHSAYGVRFLHTFRTVVQDDKNRFLPFCFNMLIFGRVGGEFAISSGRPTNFVFSTYRIRWPLTAISQGQPVSHSIETVACSKQWSK